MKAPTKTGSRLRAFTLVELLVVICIIAMLAALLLPVLSKGKAQGQSVSCQNHLHQIGLAMQMYTSDHNMYPSGFFGGSSVQTWADQLAPYDPVPWTNVAWQCPTYLAAGGVVKWQVFQRTGGGWAFEASCSYAYNSGGMIGFEATTNRYWTTAPPLGLGRLNLKVPDDRIMAPSEMYAVGDTRPARNLNQNQTKRELHGWIEMWPWILFPTTLGPKIVEAQPPHANGYNLLFADGHVSLIKRRDYLYPPRTSQNWNRDNQQHPELWAPTNEWVIQN